METDAGRHRSAAQGAADEPPVGRANASAADPGNSWAAYRDAAELLHRSSLNEPPAASLRNRAPSAIIEDQVRELMDQRRSSRQGAARRCEGSGLDKARIPESEQKSLVAIYPFGEPVRWAPRPSRPNWRIFANLWDGRHSWNKRVLSAIAGDLADILGIPEEAITRDTRYADLGLDSLDGIELAARIEDRFGVFLTDRIVADLKTKTVGDTVEFVYLSLVGKRGQCVPCRGKFGYVDDSVGAAGTATFWWVY